jgi:hypothetical protein
MKIAGECEFTITTDYPKLFSALYNIEQVAKS